MSKISVAETFLLFVIIVIDYQIDSLPTNANFTQHWDRVESFKCREPQPRAVSIYEFITIGLEGKRIIPHVTVLHRCDSGSGCCMQLGRSKCTNATYEQVTLTFTVQYTIDKGAHKSGHATYQQFVATNHTSCHCVDPRQEPR